MQLSNFWARFFAFWVDSGILWAAGAIAGLPLFDFFASLYPYGKLFGLAIATLYFGLLNSKLNEGQTLGKLLFKIATVNYNGQYLSIPRSLLRGLLLSAPFFVTGTTTGIEEIDIVLGWVSIIFYVSLFFFYIFNVKTRQSTHDLLVDSIVVDAYYIVKEPFKQQLDKRLGYGFIGLTISLAIVMLITPFMFNGFRTAETDDINSVCAVAETWPHVRGATGGYSNRVAVRFNDGKSTSQRNVYFTVYTDYDPEKLAHQQTRDTLMRSMTQLVGAKIPSLQTDYDRLLVSIVYSYDIGISKGKREYGVNYDLKK